MSEANNAKVAFMAKSADGTAMMKEASINLADYKAAASKGLSLRQHLNQKFGAEADHSFGQPFDQICQSAGVNAKADVGRGIVSPSISQMFAGVAPTAMGLDATANGPGTIVAPGGNDGTVAGRLLYPEILMDKIRDTLVRDNSDVEQGFSSMIAVTESIAGAHYIQPKFNVSQPENTPAMDIGQDAEPQVMLSITASEVARRIATKSVGLRISDEAAQYASLDLVATAIEAQTRGERIRMIENDIKAIALGDKDRGLSALTAKTITDFDAAATGGNVTQKAFLHLLHDGYQKRNLNAAIMDLDTYLAYEGRSGRPVVVDDNGKDGRVNTDIRPLNLSLGNVPVLLIDKGIMGAGTAMFLDTRYALRRVINVLASYEALESFVLRRSKALRFDYGETTERLYNEAFELVTLQ